MTQGAPLAGDRHRTQIEAGVGMLIHPQQQGGEETTGHPVGTVQTAAAIDANTLEGQTLGLEPGGGTAGGLVFIPGAGGGAQQHLGGEIVALGVGQAQEPVHGGGGFLVD